MSLLRSIVFWGLTLVLAFLFAFAGTNKLTDQLDANLNAKLTAASANWPGALEPILKYVEAAGIKVTGKQLMQSVGATEVASAALLVIGNFIGLAGLANVVLIGVMGGAVFTHVRLNEPFVFPLALGGLLTVLLLLRVTAPRAGGAKKSTSTKKQN